MGSDSNSLHNWTPKLKDDRRAAIAERRRARAVAATLEFHEAHCPVCLREGSEDIDELFVDWDRSDQQILDEFKFPLHEWKRHKKVLGLDVKRWENTEAIYEKLVQAGVNGLNGMEIKAADLLAAAARLDKVRGREKTNVNISGPQTIHINAFPMPGGIIGSNEPAKLGEVVQGKLLKAGPPEFELEDPIKTESEVKLEIDSSPEGFGDEPLLTVHDDGLVGKKKAET